MVKTYILRDTTSGVEKHKAFCETCGCTLWTIPMRHKGEKLIVRTALIDDGYVKLLVAPHLHTQQCLQMLTICFQTNQTATESRILCPIEASTPRSNEAV